MKTFSRFAILFLAVLVARCDTAPLLAPTSSTISVSAPTRVLPLGGSVDITAFVLEQAGTPVHNGTTVRFTTSLGTLNPAEAQTRNGLAVTTFHAGNVSGVAQIRAVSGAATGTAGTGTEATTTNVIEITIGAAAATRVALSASPTTVSSSGGTSEISATVLDGSGNVLMGVPVVFSTSAGSLSSSTANTDSSGRATVTLTTNRAATVTARVGGGTSAPSAEVAITTASPPSVSLAVSPASPVAGQPVTLTITPSIATGAPAPRAVVSWGDGNQEDIGAVASARSVAHTYSSPGSYTITVRTTADGESTTASAGVVVGLPPSVAVSATPTSGPAASTTFAFTITPAASGNPQNVSIDFGDGSATIDLGAVTSATTVTRRYSAPGSYTVRVTQTNTNGTTSTAVVVVTAT